MPGMPSLEKAISSNISNFASAGFSAIGSTIVEALTAPIKNRITQHVNEVFAGTVIPSPSDLIKAYILGYVSRYDFVEMMKKWGIDVSKNKLVPDRVTRDHGQLIVDSYKTVPNYESTIWRNIIASSEAVPDISSVIRAAHVFEWDDKILTDNLKKCGVNNAKNAFLNMPFAWDPKSIFSLWGYGFFDKLTKENGEESENNGKDIFESWLKASGLLRQIDRSAAHYLMPIGDKQDIVQFHNFIGSSDEDFVKELCRTGLSKDCADMQINNSKFMPSVNDLVRFSVREVWNKNVVKEYGYDDEYDTIPEYKDLAKRIGMDFPKFLPESLKGGMENWSQAFWRAHWENISPSQIYTMFHRLRPGKKLELPGKIEETTDENGNTVQRETERVTVKPVTIDDVRNVLKINDYPPAWRDRLAAISYNPMRIVDIRSTVKTALSDSNFARRVTGKSGTREDITSWAYNQFLDRGNDPETARIVADLTVTSAFRSQSLTKRSEYKVITQRYTIGLDNYADSVKALEDIGYSHDDSDAIISAIRLKIELSNIKLLKSALRKKFSKGQVNNADIRRQLTNAGLREEAISRFINALKIGRIERDVQTETQSLLHDYSQGLIPEKSLLRKLKNLGWRNPSVLIGTQ